MFKKKLIVCILTFAFSILALNLNVSFAVDTSRIVQIKGGNTFTLMLKSDGTLWGLGNNRIAWSSTAYYFKGLLADFDGDRAFFFTKLKSFSGIKAVSASYEYSLALKNDGTVWAWGNNNYGQLGNNTKVPSSTPVQVQGLTGIVAISAGTTHALALKSDGTVWAWGYNAYGQLGDQTLTERLVPVQVKNISNVRDIRAGGGHSVALKNDGTVWTWGANGNGQLGDGTTTNRFYASQVAGITNANAIDACYFSGTTYVLKSNGTVVYFGGSPIVLNADVKTPTLIPGLTNVTNIAAGTNHLIAIRNDKTVWGAGQNTGGQLGTGPNGAASSTGVQVPGLNNINVIGVGGTNSSFAVREDGAFFGWGGTKPIGANEETLPILIQPVQLSMSGVKDFKLNREATYIIKNDGTVWAWGYNGYLGTGDTDTYVFMPKQLSGLNNIIDIANGGTHCLALKGDGTVWGWGNNSDMQIGDGTSQNRNTPVAINISDVKAVSAGSNYSFALKNDGTVWAWGRVIMGSLGTKGVPTRVTQLVDVKTIYAGGNYGYALKNDGTVWAWGNNDNGQLANGTTAYTYQIDPKPVAGLSDVKAMALTSYGAAALKNDGTVWTWGHNLFGDVGDGTLEPSYVPKQVQGLGNVVSINGSDICGYVALKADGTVWAWGNNISGQMGNRSVLNIMRQAVPVKVDNLSNIVKVDIDKVTYNNNAHCIGMKNDGTLWVWGYNMYGLSTGAGIKLENMIYDSPLQITTFIEDSNHAPILDNIENKDIDEGQLVNFTINANDPDGDTLIYMANNLPLGATFDSTTGTFNWTPDYDQAGSYIVHFEVSDGKLTDSKDVIITVNNMNRAPVLQPLDNKTVDEGQLLQFAVDATDYDNDILAYSASDLPEGAKFDLVTGIFSWTPDYTEAGDYTVHFEVSDGNAIDSKDVVITVNNVNRAPVLNAIGNKTVNEGQLLQFTISATDSDGDALTYSASNLPAGATFNPATKTYSWTPTYTQAGTYTVKFSVSDGVNVVSEDITITVNNVNTIPVLNPIGSNSVDEAQNLTFTINGNDVDGDTLTYSTGTLPAGATFDAAIKTFSWTPTYTQAGTYTVKFSVSDGVNVVSEDVAITVNNVNTIPVLNPIGSNSVDEAQNLTFTINGSDVDGDTLTYSTGTLPVGATFDAATKTFSWTPTYTQAGTYTVKFSVSDGVNVVSEDVAITVIDVPPTNTTYDVITLINELNLPAGAENSLTSSTNNVIKALNKGNKNAALNELNATKNKIEAMRGKQLTNAQADELIAALQKVIDNINS